MLIQGNVSAIVGDATSMCRSTVTLPSACLSRSLSVPISAAGNFTLGVDRETAASALAGAATGYVRLYVTPGTAIAYSAFVAPIAS